MLKPRLIPVLLLKNGILVKSRLFSFHQSMGNPTGQVERFTAWKADELIYLDISREGTHGEKETMNVVGSVTSMVKNSPEKSESFADIIKLISPKCNIPLTAGGRIRSLEDIRVLLQNGADKVSINTQALEDPNFVKLAAERFGKQCIVVSVDVKINQISGKKEVYKNFGKDQTGRDPVEWCLELERLGAGEILLNSIDRDGTGQGYDLDLIKSVAEKIKIPVIALGGVGTFKHLAEGLQKGMATAVAAANIFHFTELSVINAKKYMESVGIDVRL
jgi:cyclase